jgi:hypothetical protein
MGIFSSDRAKSGLARTGRVVTLPARGRAVVISDLHGHFGDFMAFLDRSRILERISSGEDVWLLITGDVPDLDRHRALDPDVPIDGDVRILDALITAERELGALAERIVYLEGNHDFHILRIAREASLFEAHRKGRSPPAPEVWDARVEPRVLDDYFEHYRATLGEEVFENNVGPYDMIRRVEPRHLAYLARGPVLAVLEGARTLVTHAGPPKMLPTSKRTIRRSIERASREELRGLGAEEYYATPYHQILNGRFRNHDYSLEDLDAFLAVFGSSLMITGHTPHAYLVDYGRNAPLTGCAFRDGLGFVGSKQVVLCTSFGSFEPARKRYIELDLARPYGGVDDLRSGAEVLALYPEAPKQVESDETAAVVRALAERALAEGRPRSGTSARPTRTFDPRAITESGD